MDGLVNVLFDACNRLFILREDKVFSLDGIWSSVGWRWRRNSEGCSVGNRARSKALFCHFSFTLLPISVQTMLHQRHLNCN